jgi:hypothetical protein
MLSVTFKPFMMSVVRLNVVMLNVFVEYHHAEYRGVLHAAIINFFKGAELY